jgi:outer membrane immunogenic protein
MRSNVIKVLLTGVLLLASTLPAFASGPYIGASAGVSIFHDSDVNEPGYYPYTVGYDTGAGFNLSIGNSFDGGGRIEGEFGYKTASIKDASSVDANVKSFMLNSYYDFKSESTVTPYIGAGLGIINGELEVNGYKSDDTVFGYQLIVGTGISVNKNVTLDLSYRLQGAATDFNIDGADVSYLSSNVVAGVRFSF